MSVRLRPSQHFSRAGGFLATVPSVNEWLQTSYKNRAPASVALMVERSRLLICEVWVRIPSEALKNILNDF